MIHIEHSRIIDRMYFSLMGSLATLVLLAEFEFGDFASALNILMLVSIPVITYDVWFKLKTAKAKENLGFHQVVAWFALAISIGLFVAKNVFDVQAIGYWVFLPVLVFFWASWFAKEEDQFLQQGR